MDDQNPQDPAQNGQGSQGSQQTGGPAASGSWNPPPPMPMPPPQTSPQFAGGQMPPPPTGWSPPGGYTPPPAMPSPPFPPAPPTPPVVEDTTPANFQLGIKLPPVLKVKIPPHQLTFDEQHFLHMLAGSISLTKDEKRKIVESVPKLRQSQVDELIRIFEEERKKFAELSKKHTQQLENLAQKHYEEWMDLETENEQKSKAQQDEAKADEIRKQLGL